MSGAASVSPPGSKEIHQAQYSNYPFIVNDLIQKALDARINTRSLYPLYVDSIELSIAFAIGIDKKYPKELKALDKKISKIHEDFEDATKDLRDDALDPWIRSRDKDLLIVYDQKLRILIIKYNDWVQLFKKPIIRSKAHTWTAE